MDPRKLRHVARTQQILDIAMGIVVAEGLAALTIHRLARELNYTPGALYHYFPGKAAIFGELQLSVIASFHDTLTSVWSALDDLDDGAGEDVHIVSCILAATQAFLAMTVLQPGRFRLLGMVLADPNPLVDDEVFNASMGPTLALLNDVGNQFARAIELGVLHGSQPPLARVVMMWGALQGVAQMNKLARTGLSTFERGPLALELVRVVLMGQGAAPDILEGAQQRVEKVGISAIVGRE